MILPLVPKVKGAIGLHIRRGDKIFGKEAKSAAGISLAMVRQLEVTTAKGPLKKFLVNFQVQWSSLHQILL